MSTEAPGEHFANQEYVWRAIMETSASMMSFVDSYFLRRMQDERELREERWDKEYARQREFHLRLGYAKSQDKVQFVRRYFHFPSRT